MRIGVFRSCAIGDAVQLTPLFQQIKRDYPAAELVFFTSANVEPLLRGAAYLDQLVCFSTAELAAEHQWLNLWRVWGRVAKAGPFDFFLNFEPGWRRAVFLPRVKARRKAGVVYPGWKPLRLYTDVHVVEDAVDRKRHQSTLYLELWAKMSGGRVGAFGYDLSQVLRDEEELPALPEDFIVFAPGTGNFYSTVATKRWPAGHWRELAAQFQSSGRSVVWLGTESDGSLFADALLLNNFMGKLSLRQTVQVIGRSRGVVANDSGLFHVALGLQKKAAGFYGPTDPAHVGPYRTDLGLVLQSELPCVPCWQGSCRVEDPALAELSRPYCMELLRPERVFPVISSHLFGESTGGAGSDAGTSRGRS